MNLRSLRTTAGALVVAGALALGLATPASASPFPGPVVFPTCNTIVPLGVPAVFGVRLTTTTAFTYGAVDPTLTSIIAANPDLTCTFTNGSTRSVVSEVQITKAQFTQLRAYYLANGYTVRPGGGPTTPASPTDLVFWKAFGKKSTSPAELVFLSPEGWWITMRDNGAGLTGSFTYEVVDRFLELN